MNEKREQKQMTESTMGAAHPIMTTWGGAAAEAGNLATETSKEALKYYP